MRFFIIIIVSLMLMSCKGDSVEVEDSWNYEVIEIDGMTCIQWSAGLTCNWDEWEGEKE